MVTYTTATEDTTMKKQPCYLINSSNVLLSTHRTMLAGLNARHKKADQLATSGFSGLRLVELDVPMKKLCIVPEDAITEVLA